jgi:hypothetical protein
MEAKLSDSPVSSSMLGSSLFERPVTWAEAARRTQGLSSDARQKVAAAELASGSRCAAGSVRRRHAGSARQILCYSG